MGSVPLALVASLEVLDVVSIFVVDGSTLTFLVDEVGGESLRIGQAPGHAGPDLPLPFADLVAFPTIELSEVSSWGISDLALGETIEACSKERGQGGDVAEKKKL